MLKKKRERDDVDKDNDNNNENNARVNAGGILPEVIKVCEFSSDEDKIGKPYPLAPIESYSPSLNSRRSLSKKMRKIKPKKIKIEVIPLGSLIHSKYLFTKVVSGQINKTKTKSNKNGLFIDFILEVKNIKDKQTYQIKTSNKQLMHFAPEILCNYYETRLSFNSP